MGTFFLKAQKSGNDLTASLTDLRAAGFTDVYFTALLPPGSSALLKGNALAADSGMAGGTPCGSRGFKASGGSVPAEPCFSGDIKPGNTFAATEGAIGDFLSNSNALVRMCVTNPVLSGKGQALCRGIASGDKTQGVVRSLPVQTSATTKLYTAQASGPLTARTLAAQIDPLPEDRGQQRVVCSWAAAPDGRQFMQTDQGWSAMTEPMQPAMTLTVPDSGLITLPVTNGLDLSALEGTKVVIGLGTDCEEVAIWNKQGHYYTVQ